MVSHEPVGRSDKAPTYEVADHPFRGPGTLRQSPARPAGDDVLTFPVSKCRYTLPGKDWTWIDHTSLQKVICAARNGDGVIFMLAVFPAPAGQMIDEDFAAGFDRKTHPSIEKRGARITTFKGLSCYEWEWLINGTRTSATRSVIANGYAYQLQLLGTADPVEKRPDFEAIMNGFEFTSPPVPPDPLEPRKRVVRTIAHVLVYGLVGFALWGTVTMLRRRKQRA
jgi:hypothetical protein